MSQSFAERPEPKVEQLVAELRRLQRVKRTLEEEVTTSQALGDTLRGQWEALCSEAFCLEGTLKEKEGSCGVLRFKCEELEQEAQRQRAQNQEKEELLELYRCQIEETKLRHRKARVKFGKELQQLMEQHKNLYSAFSPARLPGEVAAAENAAAELLKAEKLKMSQLARLQEDLAETRGGPARVDTGASSEAV